MKRIIQIIFSFLFAISPHILSQGITTNNTHKDFLFNISKPSDLKKHYFDLDQKELETINLKSDNPPLILDMVFARIFYKTFLNGNLLLAEYSSQGWEAEGWRDYEDYSFTYDENYNFTKIVFKIGSQLITYLQSLYTYDKNENMTEYVIQQWNNSKWNNRRKYSFSYNQNNLYTEVDFYNWDGTAWIVIDRYVFEYDNHNNLTKRVLQHMSNGDWTNSQMIVYTYDENDNLTETLWLTGQGSSWINDWKINYRYNLANKILEDSTYDWDGANWIFYGRDFFYYDEQNNNIEELSQEFIDSLWVNNLKYLYTYNNENQKVTETLQTWNNSIWKDYYKIIFRYDNKGNNIGILDQHKYGSDSLWQNSSRIEKTYDIFKNISSSLTQVWSGEEWINSFREHYINIPQNGVDGNINNYWLASNYPNPFNNSTIIRYLIPKEEFVTIKIFNILGEQVDLLLNESKQAGVYEVPWNPINLPSGIYFYQLKAGDFTKTKKMILLK